MQQKNLRRTVAGLSAATLAAGLTTAFGMGAATAATDSITWEDGGSNFKRTVSDNNPAIGDTFTMTTNFYRSKTPYEDIYAVKDIRDACLTFVGANPSDKLSQGLEPNGQAFSRVQGIWDVRPLVEPKTRAFTFTYRVSETCPIGVPLNSSLHYGGSLGSGTYNNKGPIVTVKKAASTTAATIDPAPQSDRASTITATVGPDAATGEVEFFNGATSLGKADVSNHQASFAWTPTAADAGQGYSITAKYLGTATRDGSTSTALTGTVTAAPTVPAAPTGLAANPSPVIAGDVVTISGQAEANSSVKVTAGSQNCTAAADANGAFSCTITTDVAGPITVTAVATNAVGPSPVSEALTLNVDAKVVAPDAPALTVSADTVIAGETITGSATTTAGNTLVIKAGNAELFNGISATGTETFSHVTTTDGTIELTATAGNSAGTSPAATKIVTVEKRIVAPDAPALAVSADTITEGEGVTVAVTTEAGNTVVISANGTVIETATAGANGIVTTNHASTTAGDIEFTATASNSAGASPVATKTITVNAKVVAPNAPRLTVTPLAVTEGDTVTVNAVTDPGNKLVITADGVELFNGVSVTGTESKTFVPKAVGTSAVSATAGNSAGASTPAAETVTVNAKVVAPDAPDAPALTVSADTVIAGDTITGTATTTPGNNLVIKAGDTKLFDDISTTGTETFSHVTTTVGSIEFTATAGNSAGASAPASKTVTVKAPPVAGEAVITLSSASPKAGDKVEITVTGADAGTAFTISSGTVTLCEGIVAADGIGTCVWTATEGAHTLTATAIVDGKRVSPTTQVTVAGATTPGGGTGSLTGSGSLGSLFNIFSSLS